VLLDQLASLGNDNVATLEILLLLLRDFRR
jgi:hypothetical protein